jgi:hypothetical protein
MLLLALRAQLPMGAAMKLKCSLHGSAPWRFTIVCSKCERAYQAVLEGTPFEPVCSGAKRAPIVCECGSRLPGKEGTARAICTRCFLKRVAS